MALENKFKEAAENPFYTMGRQKLLNEKKFMGSRCKKCGTTYVPTKSICPKCKVGEMELVEMKGKGKLAAYTVINVGSPLMLEEGFDRNNPYCSGVVEMEEGPRITARILGADLAKPENNKIGTPVNVEYVEAEHGGEKTTFLAFRLLS